MVVVTAFPSGDNLNVSERPDTTAAADSSDRRDAGAPPTVAAQHITPQKARILLMLALTRTHDPREVQRYFETY